MLDPALRRPGRFDRELEISVPGKEGRLSILKIHTRNIPKDKSVNLEEIAEVTYGFVGADLAALAKEAAMIVLRRVLPDMNLNEEKPITNDLLEKLMVTQHDFREALKVVRPSAMRELLVELPNIKWSDVGGLESVKQELKEAVEWPLKNPQVFSEMGIRPPKGILLYGAPGTGKTMLAKAVASESHANFISVKGPEIVSKWVNETPLLIKKLFDKARQVSPSIIFIDEIDSIASKRNANQNAGMGMSAVETILTEMDGIVDMSDVVIIAATNRPDMIDTALLRPGRFDRLVLVPAPNLRAREEILKIHTKNMPLDKEINIKQLAQLTECYVGADLEAICREAAMLALRENIKARVVKAQHFDEAQKKIRPSATKDVEAAYEEIGKAFRSARGKEMKEEKPSYYG
jgi:transitional endoplasmic reticulum ATPase